MKPAWFLAERVHDFLIYIFVYIVRNMFKCTLNPRLCKCYRLHSLVCPYRRHFAFESESFSVSERPIT